MVYIGIFTSTFCDEVFYKIYDVIILCDVTIISIPRDRHACDVIHSVLSDDEQVIVTLTAASQIISPYFIQLT